MDKTATQHEPAEERVSALYSRLLGGEWAKLDECVRWAHSNGVEKRGMFRITHGTGWLARSAVRSSHLPQAANVVETRLKIITDDVGERWERSFNGEMFTTQQWAAGGMLVERFGAWELRFALRVEQGALVYEQRGARFCAGSLRLPMLLACAPFVEAREWFDNKARVRVTVKVTLPIVGLLIAYDGHIIVKTKTT